MGVETACVTVCFISAILIASSLQNVHCTNIPPVQSLTSNEIRRVLVTHNDLPQVGIDLLKKTFNVTVLPSNSPSEEEVLKILPEYDALLSRMKVDAKVLDVAGSRLKVIVTPSAGYDQLDIAEIKKRGIRVGHTPTAFSDAVAEIAVFLVLGAARRVHEGRVNLERGETAIRTINWKLGHDLRGKTVGIVGLGNIGVEIAKRLQSFKVKKFVYSGHSRKPEGDALGAEFVTFDSLLEQSDFIFDAVPLNAETENMFNDAAFKKMKSSAVFVNIGRGKTVDTDALVRALKSKTIFAAGLDVTEPEPLPVDHELLKLPNAVITPHLGGQSIESQINMSLDAAQSIIDAFNGKRMAHEL